LSKGGTLISPKPKKVVEVNMNVKGKTLDHDYGRHERRRT
jgi:hypothetical protein